MSTSNTFLTSSVIADEGLMQLENNMVLGNNVHRKYKKEFVKVGATVSIRKPVKFTVTDGATRSNQDITQSNTSIVINKRKHVSYAYSTQDMTLSIDEYSEQFVKPAMIALGNKVDEDGCSLYKDLWTRSGTPGTTPATFAALGSAAQYMDDAAIPDDGMRKLILDPAARWAIADGLKTLNNQGMASDFVRKGRLGEIANFDIYGDQNIIKHTVGNHGGTPLVKGASQTGSSLITDGWTNSVTGILLQGDEFTIAGVYEVNPVSRLSTGRLQHFTVTADADSGASTGPSTLSIAPSIIATGAYQTVTALPADNAAITVIGTANTAYAQNLAYHKYALALVVCPIELPSSAVFKARATYNDLSLRVVKAYDVDKDEEVIRHDILYGWKAIYPELGSRIWG
ncbi:MAG: hypothetical protein BMS9Abin31_0701 [Gammaproteobacteria bacterium]|nr:MAG: hypothetical protein BMS9Abin31_0701 [Gammaproteobacteria bacterium]